MKTFSFAFTKLARWLSGCVWFMATVLLASSCSDDGSSTPENPDPVITEQGTPAGDVSSSNIGTSGGTVSSADGKLTVTIPAGALTSNTNISIQPITNEGPLGVGYAYRLQPEGLTFSLPVTLTLKYEDNLLDGTPADFLWIITQASDGSWNALLKSEVDDAAKTVSVTTLHFSDWALGKFMDLTLTPSSKTIKKEQSVELHLSGFSKGSVNENMDLVPLAPIEGSGDELTPLTTIPPVESQLIQFNVKGWNLNGTAAPVSNSNGQLKVSGNVATYTAPNHKPSTNPVAVTVALEGISKNGTKVQYMLTSSITVVENDLYILVEVDGIKYEYYQYGFDGAIPPDPNNIAIANCGLNDNKLGFGGTLVQNSTSFVHSLSMQVENPAVTTKTLVCYINGGNDDMSFTFGTGTAYEIMYEKRVKSGDVCNIENLCGETSVTFLDYTGTTESLVRGYFSATLFEDNTELSAQCKTPIPHTVSGEFRLKLAN